MARRIALPEKKKRKLKTSYFVDCDPNEPDEVVYLWRACLDQAFDDYQKRDKLTKVLRDEITKWVQIDNEDFLAVCSYAKLSPSIVLKVFTNVH